MNPILSILLILALVGVIIYIIVENRHPIQTLAWIIAIIFLPVAGLVLYFLVGHRPWGHKMIEKDELEQLKELTRKQHRSSIVEPPADHNGLAKMLQAANYALPMTGNALKPYTEFYPMLDDLLADLEAARDHSHFEFFKFEDDPSGRRVAEVLMRKARSGITVRLQYDDLANINRKRFYRELRRSGVQVKSFLALTIPFVSGDLNFRNHRKIVVIDGRVGYLGGMNIAERYGAGLKWGSWRDTHLRIEGPAVAELQTAFLTDWKFSSGELLAEPRYYPSIPSTGDTLMQIITSGAMDEWRIAMQSLVRLISNARSYVYIQTPYFIPTESVMLALRNAALSGVDVRLMIPARGDRGPLVSLASKSFIADAMAAGVQVWFYRKGFLHAKTVVSDDSFASIGSANVDVRSHTLDFEINACIYDAGMALEMKEVFLRDQADSEHVDPARWASRPAFEKLKESLARLLSPLM